MVIANGKILMLLLQHQGHSTPTKLPLQRFLQLLSKIFIEIAICFLGGCIIKFQKVNNTTAVAVNAAQKWYWGSGDDAKIQKQAHPSFLQAYSTTRDANHKGFFETHTSSLDCLFIDPPPHIICRQMRVNFWNCNACKKFAKYADFLCFLGRLHH